MSNRLAQIKVRRLIFWSGLLLGLGLLAYFLIRVDWRLLALSLQELRPPLLLVSGVLLLLASLLRGLRWELLLRSMPPSESIKYTQRLKHCWQALCIGYLGNMIYPAKAGEMLRMLEIQRRLKVEWGCAIATVALDRLLDVCGVLLLGGVLAYSVFSDDPSVKTTLFSLTLFFVAVCVVIAAIIYARVFLKKIIQWALSPLPVWLYDKCLAVLDGAFRTLLSVRSPGRLLGGAACSVCAIFVDAVACWALMGAFGWSLPLWAGLGMELALCIVGSLPAAPGYIGLYQAAGVLVLTRFGLAETQGVAYALLLQLLVLLVFGLTGGWALLASRKEGMAREI